MTKYILNRLFHSVLVMLTISFIVFFIMFKAGDPVELMLPPDATQQDVIDMRVTLGLDKSFIVQLSKIFGKCFSRKPRKFFYLRSTCFRYRI